MLYVKKQLRRLRVSDLRQDFRGSKTLAALFSTDEGYVQKFLADCHTGPKLPSFGPPLAAASPEAERCAG